MSHPSKIEGTSWSTPTAAISGACYYCERQFEISQPGCHLWDVNRLGIGPFFLVQTQNTYEVLSKWYGVYSAVITE